MVLANHMATCAFRVARGPIGHEERSSLSRKGLGPGKVAPVLSQTGSQKPLADPNVRLRRRVDTKAEAAELKSASRSHGQRCLVSGQRADSTMHGRFLKATMC